MISTCEILVSLSIITQISNFPLLTSDFGMSIVDVEDWLGGVTLTVVSELGS
jgi:hypothetical protein